MTLSCLLLIISKSKTNKEARAQSGILIGTIGCEIPADIQVEVSSKLLETVV